MIPAQGVAIRAPHPERSAESVAGNGGLLRPVSQSVGAAIFVFWVLSIFLGAAWYEVNPRGIFFLVGAAACGIVSIPLIVGRYDLLSPWSLVMLAAYVGYGLRGLFISLGVNGSRSLDELYFLGHQPSYFERPSFLFLIGTLIFTLGYLCTRARPRRLGRSQKRDLASGAQVTLVVVICALVGFVTFFLYVRATGGFSLSSISAKRTLINGTNLSASYQSHGGLRFVNGLAALAFWLQVAWYAYCGERHGPKTLRGSWLGLLFLNAAALPIFANTRSDVVLMIVSALCIEFCLRGQTVSRRVVIGSGAVAIGIAIALTSMRMAHSGEVSSINVSGETFVDTFVLTRTFADIPTTGNIINAVPSRLAFANGRTITAWLVAPVPRSFWPGKPIISSGPEVAAAIYGNNRTGVPPGLIAESYWNFGIGGIIMLPLLSGLLLGWLYNRWSPHARSSPAAAMLVSIVAIRTGVDLTSNGVGYALYQAISSIVLLVPVVLLASSGALSPDPPTRLRFGSA